MKANQAKLGNTTKDNSIMYLIIKRRPEEDSRTYQVTASSQEELAKHITATTRNTDHVIVAVILLP